MKTNLRIKMDVSLIINIIRILSKKYSILLEFKQKITNLYSFLSN